MRDQLQKTKPYTIVILHKTSKAEAGPVAARVIWEHGRRNFQLRRDGKLSVVCPVRDESDVSGVGIFSCDLEETRKIMDGDPAVQAGFITYETHSTRSFPGDSLPK